MDQVPKMPNGLRKRGNTYEYRKVVPEDVRILAGKKEIIRSLKTSDSQTALRRYRIQMLDVENQIDALRRQLEQQKAAQNGTPPICPLSTEEIQSIVLTWFHELESGSAPEAEQSRGDPESVDAIEDAVKGDLGALAGLPEGELWVMSQTDALLAKHSISIAKDSREYHIVRTLVERGLIENRTRRLDDIGRGRFDADPYFRDVEYVSPLPEFIKNKAPRMEYTFSDLLKRYLKEKTVAKKTREQYEQHSRRFIEFIGAKTPVESISREDILNYRNLLRDVPSNASKLFEGKTFQQIAESPKAARLDKLHPRSINKVLETLSALFNLAEDWDLIRKNPAKGLQLPIDDSHESTQRRPYTIEKLQQVFNAPLFPALAYAENGGDSDGFQKWYNRFLKSIGLKGGTAKAGLVFHSFRHTPRDRLREAEVHGEFVNRLGDWTESTSTA